MKLYTLEEIAALNPPGFKRYFTPRSYQAHPTISHRREFSEREAAVYDAIVAEVRRVNPGQIGLRCWAIGSRVTGRWRTREQSEMLAAEGYPLKYSDWDCATNARNLPSREEIAAALEGFGERGHVIRFRERQQNAVPLVVPGPQIGAVIRQWTARFWGWLPIK